jgi:ferredoxin
MPVNWVPRNGARCRNCRVDVAAGPLLPELMMARGLQNVSQPGDIMLWTP